MEIRGQCQELPPLKPRMKLAPLAGQSRSTACDTKEIEILMIFDVENHGMWIFEWETCSFRWTHGDLKGLHEVLMGKHMDLV